MRVDEPGHAELVQEARDVGVVEPGGRDLTGAAPVARPFAARPNAFWISRRASRLARSWRLS